MIALLCDCYYFLNMKKLSLLLLFLIPILHINSQNFTRELYSSNNFRAALTDRPYLYYRTFLHNRLYNYAALEFVSVNNPSWGFDVGYFFLQHRARHVREFENYDFDPMILMAEYFFSFKINRKQEIFWAVGAGSMMGLIVEWEILSVIGAGTFSAADISRVNFGAGPVFNFIAVPVISFRGMVRL